MSQPYIILEAENPSQLASYVNSAIAQGYEPVGGLVFVPGIVEFDSFRYYQSLINTALDIEPEPQESKQRAVICPKCHRELYVDFTATFFPIHTPKFNNESICSGSKLSLPYIYTTLTKQQVQICIHGFALTIGCANCATMTGNNAKRIVLMP